MTTSGQSSHAVDAAALRATSVGRTLRREVGDVLHGAGSLRLAEVLLGFGLMFELAYFGLPLALSDVVMILIIGLSLLRRPTLNLGRLQVIVPLLVLGLLYLGLLSMFADPSDAAADWKRRLIRLSLVAVFLLVVASGRIDIRSLLVGIGIGLVVNAVLFYAGIAPDTYGGVLSGYFGDKNVAGLAYSVYGVLLLYLTEKRWARLAIFIGLGGLIWLTESRTAISAFVAAGLWILLAGRLPNIGRWLLGLAIFLGVRAASEDYSQVGVFSNRVGSDLLRARIDAASEIKVRAAGFFGDGLGEAYVQFTGQTRTWFFHNSYWSALVEGGWPWLLLILAVTVLFAMQPFRRTLTPRQVGAQAAIICVLICAWRLGEVLFTTPWAVAIAFALAAFAPRGGETAPSMPQGGAEDPATSHVVLPDREDSEPGTPRG